MTDKARELLERALDGLNWYEYKDLMEEIRSYLAQPRLTDEQKEALAKELCFHNHGDRLEQYAEQVLTSCIRCGGSGCEQDSKPEVKREALSVEEIDQELLKNDYYLRSFTAGVRFAEKHHGIGCGDE